MLISKKKTVAAKDLQLRRRCLWSVWDLFLRSDPEEAEEETRDQISSVLVTQKTTGIPSSSSSIMTS